MGSDTTALAVIAEQEREGAGALMRRASDVAGVCREIVLRTAMELQGKRYVRVEGWQSIAAAYGCFPSIREVVEEEKGIRAIAELRRFDGVVIAQAEGYCGLDEPRWANQAMYARRGMASTRAISRVCRSVFAFCVVLIDENLQTTPAEEIPMGGPAANSDAVVEVDAKPVATARQTKPNEPAPIRDKSTQVTFGKNKGKFFCDLSDDDLMYQFSMAQKSVDANDSRWHPLNVKRLETIQAEVTRRSFGK